MTDDEIIAVVAAHKEGKKIEYSWGACVNWYGFYENALDKWNFAKYSYRVAPESHKPREGWIHESALIAREPVGHDFMKVREILE